jgi:hypothetical protein
VIPLVATFRLQLTRPDREPFQLWLPVPLVIVWLLLLPFAIVLLPLFVIACLAVRMRPLRTLAVLWGVFSALNDLDVALVHRDASIHIRL